MPTLFFEQALLPDGWAADVRVVVDGGTIAEVTARASRAADDETHAIGIPGMPNVHSHAFQRAMVGLTEVRGPVSDTFWTWREQMYRSALTMSPDDVETVAAQLYMEMLEAGFTRVGEFHYLHHDRDGRPYADRAEMAARLAAASATAGIGLTLLPVFYAHAGFGGLPPQPAQRRFVCDLDGYARLVDASRDLLRNLPGAALGLAPHSLRAVTPDQLRHVIALLPAAPIHIHVAEQAREVDDCIAWSGRRPVQWLLEEMAPDARWCFIHATHMTADETQAMAAAGVTAGLCPLTEASLGDGVFNAPAFIRHGGVFGIGSDSNGVIGVAGELRQLEFAQRIDLRRRNILAAEEGCSTGRSLYDHAVRGGHKAVGGAAGRRVAGIALGASADIVSLDTDNAAFASRNSDSLLDSWIFGTHGRDIDCVWRAGSKCVAGGRHLHRAAIERRFRATLQRLAA